MTLNILKKFSQKLIKKVFNKKPMLYYNNKKAVFFKEYCFVSQQNRGYFIQFKNKSKNTNNY